uniref:AlNc14C255G9712 protein n=1 Tax=Albugo laibachii Nc14 TaxID=890382 RepID=F0WTN5_9STRA|nr:AlNc14C255G9712 [Albugo laibachii Nc14]|eukprot:CCA24727.1 AlNc14C255G9712 [Albugo laibachii Nc14]
MENHKFVHHFRTCPSSIILDTGSDSQHHKEENIMLISGKTFPCLITFIGNMSALLMLSVRGRWEFSVLKDIGRSECIPCLNLLSVCPNSQLHFIGTACSFSIQKYSFLIDTKSTL